MINWQRLPKHLQTMNNCLLISIFSNFSLFSFHNPRRFRTARFFDSICFKNIIWFPSGKHCLNGTHEVLTGFSLALWASGWCNQSFGTRELQPVCFTPRPPTQLRVRKERAEHWCLIVANIQRFFYINPYNVCKFVTIHEKKYLNTVLRKRTGKVGG